MESGCRWPPKGEGKEKSSWEREVVAEEMGGGGEGDEGGFGLDSS
jgi:hypothetical protein